MGVALAYKTSKYTAEAVDLCRLSDTKPWPRPPKPSGLRARASAALSASALARAWRAFTKAQPPRDDWGYAKGRFNSLVFARLRDARTGGVFAVATYHMPCAFWAPAVMTIHCALAAQRAAALAAGVPFVLAGDFNVKPGDPQYALLTTGSLPADAGAAAPDAPSWEPWRAAVAAPLRSAYAEAHGAEPAFTNCAGVRDEPLFVECLDYIFVSEGVQVLDADALPATKDGATQAYPTAEEPSDHVLLVANMRV
jgi:endonuclease/exonuclease/phosphatase family metal-dependent hydrolase